MYKATYEIKVIGADGVLTCTTEGYGSIESLKDEMNHVIGQACKSHSITDKTKVQVNLTITDSEDKYVDSDDLDLVYVGGVASTVIEADDEPLIEKYGLFILHGYEDGNENEAGDYLDMLIFTKWSEAYAYMKGIYEHRLATESYDKTETSINEWGCTVAIYDGWLTMQITEFPVPDIVVPLPDGRILRASSKQDNDYPGIQIVLQKGGEAFPNDDIIVWAEYNTGRPEYSDQQKLRIIAWKADHDEPVVNLGYDTGDFERD